VTYSNRKSVTCRTSLIGLSVLLHKAILIVYSRGVLQPSDIKRFRMGVSLLSPLRPVHGNGEPLTELLGNALTLELRARSPASCLKSSVDNRPADNALLKLPATAVAPGSWAYVRRGQPNEETDCRSSCRCQEGPSDEKDYRK